MYLLDIYQKDLEIWMISIRLIQSLSLTSLFYGLEYASYQELRDCERSRDSGFVEIKIFMYLFFYFIIPASFKHAVHTKKLTQWHKMS